MDYKNKFYIGMVSTVPPRKCGIAKFNWDFFNSIKNDYRIHDKGFYSIVKEPLDYDLKTKKLVEKEINQDETESWRSSLDDMIEKTIIRRKEGIDSGFFFQHEYGIFGRDHDSDDNIVYMLEKLKDYNIPTITITHTLERGMSDFKNNVMKGILEYTDKVVCLTPSAVGRFREMYNAPRGKLIHIQHGVPRVEITETKNKLKKYYGFVDEHGKPRKVISNVGLLSDGKGIQYALEGFASFLNKEKSNNLIYCVAGETHPEVKRKEGESYRESSLKLAHDLGLKAVNYKPSENSNVDLSKVNVVFYDKYLDDMEYLKFMKMSDLGLVTNQGKDQISSGQIAYWVGMGRPVIATESPYAKDMEDEGIGLLVKFGDSKDISDTLEFYFNLPEREQNELENLALGKGATMTWPIVGQSYINLMESLIEYKKS